MMMMMLAGLQVYHWHCILRLIIAGVSEVIAANRLTFWATISTLPGTMTYRTSC